MGQATGLNHTWADLEGRHIYRLFFHLFAVGPKTMKCRQMGLIIGRRGEFSVQPALFFEPGPFPGLPAHAVGPKGLTIGQKPWAGLIMLSSLRSAQIPVVQPYQSV